MVSPLETLTNYLKTRPDTHILWGDVHMPQYGQDGVQFWRGWIDVYVPDILEHTKTGWVWTIEGNKDDLDEEEQSKEPLYFVIPLEYDLDVYSIWDNRATKHDGKNGEWFTPDYTYHIVKNKGVPLTEGEQAELDKLVTEGAEREILQYGAWTQNLVEQAMSTWCREHTGRTFTFEYEPDQKLSGMALKFSQELENYDEEDTYVFEELENGTTVKVSSQVFDTFLENPELAKRAMEVFRDHPPVTGN